MEPRGPICQVLNKSGRTSDLRTPGWASPRGWRAALGGRAGRLLAVEATLRRRRRQGSPPPLDRATRMLTGLPEGRTPPSRGGPDTSAGSSAAGGPSPHPGGYRKPSEETGSALIYCVPSCVYSTGADSVIRSVRACAGCHHGCRPAILGLYYQSLERDREREKVQSQGELVDLTSGSGHSEGAQK